MSPIGKSKRALLTVAMALASTQAIADKALDPDITQLLVQGHYWVDQGRYELARFAWDKVLRVEPDNHEANFGITDLDALHPELIDHDELLRARALARQGQYSEALAAYRAAFRGYQPGSLLSAEYLETLSGTFNGWDPAVSDLRKLTQRFPSSQRYQLIYHRVLSYRERGRREAITGLRKLIDDEQTLPDTRRKANRALRNALLWLSPKPSDKVLFERYLATNPDDNEIQKQLSLLDLARGDTLKSSWALLDRREYAAAALGFEAVLNMPELRGSALAGLGLTRLGQKRFSEAAYLLTQAQRADSSVDVDTALEDARFWAGFHAALHAQQRGKFAYAEQQAKTLFAKRPNSTEVQLLVASINLDIGHYQEAVEFYEQALRSNLNSKDARKGLLAALVYLEDEEKARWMLRRYDLSEAEFETARNRRLADELRLQALASRDRSAAIAKLQVATELSPEHAWVRLELARLLLIAEGEDVADSVFEQAPKTIKNETAYQHSLAIYRSENGFLNEAQQLLDGIPSTQQNYAINQLRAENSLRLQHLKIQQLLRIGDQASAAALLPADETINAGTPAQQLIYAEMLADLSQLNSANELAQRAYANVTFDDFKHGVLYTDYLIRRGQLASADATAGQLDQEQRLTLHELNTLKDLQQRLLFAQSWAAVEAEDYPSALAYLAELEESLEQTEDVLMLRGFLLSEQEAWVKSLAAYEHVIAANPHKLDAISAAYGINLKLGRLREAQHLLENSLSNNPTSGLLQAYKGQLAEIQGQRLRAKLSYQKALSFYQKAARDSDKRQQAPQQAQKPLEPPTWVDNTRESLARIDLDTNDWVASSIQLRTRGGEDGIDALDEVTLPLRWKNYLNNGQALTATVVPVFLDSGSLDKMSPNSYWGSLPLTADSVTSVPATEEQGIALSLGLESDSWKIELGTTPIGFESNELVGELQWHNQSLINQLTLAIERDAIKESALAYAGYMDPATGLSWGAVTRTGARVEATWPRGLQGTVGRIAVYQYEGDNTENNAQTEVLAGHYWNKIRAAHPRFDAGMSLRLSHFDNDQNHFTLGHGGYFSPQQYYAISIPLTVTEHRGRVELGLTGNFGYQYYETDDTEVFPIHPDLQGQLDNSGASTKVFTGDTVNGFTYSLKMRSAYSFSPTLQVGAWIASQHSQDYSETGAGVFVRYSLFDNVRDQQQFRSIDSELFEEQW